MNEYSKTFFNKEVQIICERSWLEVLIIKWSVSTSMPPSNPRMPPATFCRKRFKSSINFSYVIGKEEDYTRNNILTNEGGLLINNTQDTKK